MCVSDQEPLSSNFFHRHRVFSLVYLSMWVNSYLPHATRTRMASRFYDVIDDVIDNILAWLRTFPTTSQPELIKRFSASFVWNLCLQSKVPFVYLPANLLSR